MKRPMTHSSLENVASLSSAARDDASGRGNGVRVEADLTGSAKDGGEVWLQPVQTDAEDQLLGLAQLWRKQHLWSHYVLNNCQLRL